MQATVTGDADSVRQAGRAWGQQAQAAEAQVHKVQAAAGSITVQKLTGPAGDRLRGYMGQLASSGSAVCAAYRQLSLAAPRMADAIDASKAAEKALRLARAEYWKAVADVAAAEAELSAAVAKLAVEAAKSVLPGVHGSTAAAQHAVDRAEKEVAKARAAADKAEAVATKAETTFEHAEQDRQRISSAFSRLCVTQMASANSAMPTAPKPPHLPQGLNLLTYSASLARIKVAGLESIVAYGKSAPGVPVPGGSVSALERFTGRATKLLGHAGTGLSIVSAILPVLGRDDLTPREKAETAEKTFLTSYAGGQIGGATGAALCSGMPVAEPMCIAGGSLLGGVLFSALGKIKPVDHALGYVVHETLRPVEDAMKDIATGDITHGVQKILLGPEETLGKMAKDGVHRVFHPHMP